MENTSLASCLHSDSMPKVEVWLNNISTQEKETAHFEDGEDARIGAGRDGLCQSKAGASAMRNLAHREITRIALAVIPVKT